MTQAQFTATLPDIVRRLCAAFAPLKIYLFGSCATGTPGADSDVDLLVVVAKSDQSFFARGASAYKALRGVPVPIDVQVYTQEEFESRSQLPVSFERTVQTKGRVVYAA